MFFVIIVNGQKSSRGDGCTEEYKKKVLHLSLIFAKAQHALFSIPSTSQRGVLCSRSINIGF